MGSGRVPRYSPEETAYNDKIFAALHVVMGGSTPLSTPMHGFSSRVAESVIDDIVHRSIDRGSADFSTFVLLSFTFPDFV